MHDKRDPIGRRQPEGVERKLLKGLESSVREMGTKEWSKLRQTLRAKLAKRRKGQ